MSLIDRRSLLVGSAAATSLLLASRPSHAEELPGVTATELRIGSTAALSGPVSLLGTIARCQAAYFDMVNEAGGVGGRKIKFIYYDDAFNPAKTVEQVRRLIESDEVAFLFSTLGTAPNSVDRQIRQHQEDPPPLPHHQWRQMGGLRDLSLEHGLRAQRPDRSQDLRDARPEGDAECEIRAALCRTMISERTSSTDCATSLATVTVRPSRHFIREYRPNRRFADRGPSGQQCRRPDHGRHRKIRRPVHPQGQ